MSEKIGLTWTVAGKHFWCDGFASLSWIKWMQVHESHLKSLVFLTYPVLRDKLTWEVLACHIVMKCLQFLLLKLGKICGLPGCWVKWAVCQQCVQRGPHAACYALCVQSCAHSLKFQTSTFIEHLSWLEIDFRKSHINFILLVIITLWLQFSELSNILIGCE